jgi:hypothetical protein
MPTCPFAHCIGTSIGCHQVANIPGLDFAYGILKDHLISNIKTNCFNEVI